MIDNRTPEFDLPIPHPGNLLQEDVIRLREAFQALDAALAEVQEAGVSTVATLGTVQQIAEAVAGLRVLMASNDPALATLQALVNAVKLRAPILSPAFSGAPTAPTAAPDDASTRIATTAFVLGQASSATPLVDGVAAPGSSPKLARGDHCHPVDTTRAPINSPKLTGVPEAPTPAADDSTTKLATTAFVLGQAGTVTPQMDGAAAAGTATRFARADHRHPTDTTRAPIDSPTLTGTPRAPTPSATDVSTRIATTEQVRAAILERYPFRNRVLNGAMQVAQLGASFTSPIAGAYLLDQWMLQKAGAINANVAQSSSAPAGFSAALALTVTSPQPTAAGTYLALEQLIEGYNVADLVGVPLALSFWVRAAAPGTYYVALRNGGKDRSYVAGYSVASADTWERKTVLVPAGLITGGTWDWQYGTGLRLGWCVMGGAPAPSADAWVSGSYLHGAGQTNGATAAGAVFALTGVQLEPGVVATRYEHAPIDRVLAQCYRHFCQIGFWEDSEIWHQTGYARAGSMFGGRVPFPVEMRDSPEVIVRGTDWYRVNAGVPTAQYTSPRSTFLGALPVTAGNLASFASKGQDSYLMVDARLV